MGNPQLPTGPPPHGVPPCVATSSPTSSGHGLPLCCHTGLIAARRATRLMIPVRSSMGSSGSSIPAPRGATLPERYGPWGTVFARFNGWREDGTWGPHRHPRCWTNWTTEGRSTTISGVSMAPSSGPAGRAAGAKKKKTRGPRLLGGPKAAQMQEPSDPALGGRSRGGFGTKVHLVCDSHGFIVAIHLTAGQAHESRAFEATMARRLFQPPPRPTTLAAATRGRQGVQLPAHPAVVSAAADRSDHPHAIQPAAGRTVR